MTTLVARAPGTLFLLGEYAVLDGAPAIVAAVDRFIEVRVTPRSGRTMRIGAPGICDAIEFDAGRPPPHAALRFALAAYAQATATYPRLATTGFDIAIEGDLNAPRSGNKLELGSNAAVTVAVNAALFAAAGIEAAGRVLQDAVFSAAYRAHHAAQDEIGSGGDVAASCFGGIVLFEPRPQALPRPTTLSLPPWAILLAASTGESAPTLPLVAQYRALSRDERTTFIRLTRGSVEWFATSLRRQAVSLTALDAAANALAQLAETTGLPPLTPRLRTLIAIARAYGAAAKPSVAGGGDCGIALTTNATAAGRIRTAWREAGLVPLDLQISGEGVGVAVA
jgi:phosphomevalonate kinase